jgi:hypothetical protein
MAGIRLIRFLDYIPPLIAFAAAVVGVLGAPKWDAQAAGLSRITPMGWLVLAIGATALSASVLLTARNHREQTNQKQAKERITEIGKSQILRAINHTVFPFQHDTIWRRQCGRPESPLDLLDDARRECLATLDLNSDSTYRNGSYDVVKWHNLLQSAAQKGAEEIRIALQIYASYLPPDVMEATTSLLYSRFLQYRLLLIHDVIDANTHNDPNRPVLFFWVRNDRMHNAEYEELWDLLAKAMALCGAQMTSTGNPRFLY